MKSNEAGQIEELEEILSVIKKNKGMEDSLFLLDGPIEKVPVIPTGILSLDIATGVGGVPRRGMIEIYWPD